METPQSNPVLASTPESQKTSKVSFKKIIIIIFSLFISLFVSAVLISIFIESKSPQQYWSDDSDYGIKKPIIYLYPTIQQDIEVQLDYQGSLIADFPKYDTKIKGWKVSASPDGTLMNYADNREYSYIFWEGLPEKKIDWDLSEGFVVKGVDTREFLQEKLAFMGLSAKEYNEFIVYWYPLMQNNPYNLIHFAGTQYTETAPLTITPAPDAMLRIFMVYKPLQEKISIKEQLLKSFERKGFTVIEWGGTEAK